MEKDLYIIVESQKPFLRFFRVHYKSVAGTAEIVKAVLRAGGGGGNARSTRRVESRGTHEQTERVVSIF